MNDAAEEFRRRWAELERFANETGRLWREHTQAALESVRDVHDKVAAAAAEDEINRYHEFLVARQAQFVDTLLELRKFAADHDLIEPVRYIDSQLSRMP
jgi:hypothetical protein